MATAARSAVASSGAATTGAGARRCAGGMAAARLGVAPLPPSLGTRGSPAARLAMTPSLGARGVATLDSLGVLPSAVDTRSDDFARNAAEMARLAAEFRSRQAVVAAGGGAKAVERHVARNKLPPRERIAALLDAGSPFLELSALAGWELYGDDAVPAGGIVTGIGRVHGSEVMVVANDATVKGGTYYPITV